MPTLIFDVYDPATHQLVFSRKNFTFLTLADFNTGTTAGTMNLTSGAPAGSTVVTQQQFQNDNSAPPTVTVSGNTVSWGAGAQSTHVRVLAF